MFLLRLVCVCALLLLSFKGALGAENVHPAQVPAEPAGDRARARLQMEPIVVSDGTPGESLSEDPIVPSSTAKNPVDHGGGSLGRALGEKLSLPILESATPGGLAQLRGLGRSAEEVSVQTLGVPLNGPQGGGMDLSVFPQYLWSGFSFQLNPSLSGFDPRGIAGSLNLTPWTAEELRKGHRATPDESHPNARGTVLYSDANLIQFSAGASGKGRVGNGDFYGGAVLAGASSGSVRGPSGSLSLERDFGRTKTTFHLLATSLTADSPGSKTYPSPDATQLSRRVIPFLQTDIPLGMTALLKSGFFYDFNEIQYTDTSPTFPSSFHTLATQFGVENAVLLDSWKLGVSVRRVTYVQESSESPEEILLNLQASYLISIGDWLIDPSVQGIMVSQQGFFPGASLGAKYEFGRGGQALFGRASLSHRLPSLLNRYFAFPTPTGFRGNPDLKAEEDWTLNAGWSIRNSEFENTLQGYAQWRQDAQVSLPTTIFNGGGARVLSLMESLSYSPVFFLEMSNSMTWTTSSLDYTGSSFVYLPAVTDVLSIHFRSRPENFLWKFGAGARFSDSALIDANGGQVPGYGVLDLDAAVGLTRSVRASARLENVFDRQYELIKDYLVPGRTLVVSLMGEL